MKKYILFSIALFFALTCNAQWQTNGPYGGYIPCMAANASGIFVCNVNSGGVYFSADSGNTWTPANNGLTGGATILAVAGTRIYAAAAYSGVFVSANNGTSWAPVNAGLPATLAVSGLAVIGSDIFASTIDSGIFISTNNGVSWSPVNNGLNGTAGFSVPPFIWSLAANGTDLYAGNQWGDIFVSTNKGASWVERDSGLTDPNGVVALAASGSTVINSTNFGYTYISTNKGQSWTEVEQGLNGAIPASFTIKGNSIYACTDSGIFVTTNKGLTWTKKNNGLTNLGAVSLLFYGTHTFAGTSSGLYTSANNGNTWTLTGLLSTYVTALLSYNDNMYAGTEYDGIFISSNQGASWARAKTPVSYVSSLAFGGGLFFAGTYNGIYSSVDGTNWVYTSAGLPYSGNIQTISIASGPAGIFAASDQGFFTYNGSSWSAVNTGDSNVAVNSVCVNGNTVIAGTDAHGIFIYSNGTWKSSSTGLKPYEAIGALAVSGSNIIAVGINGLYISGNGGTSWTLSTSGIDPAYKAGAITVYDSIVYVSAYNFTTNTSIIYQSLNNGLNWSEFTPQINTSGIHCLTASSQGVLFAGTSNGAYQLVPSPTANAGPNSVICVGSTTQLGGTPTASGGTPPYSYKWSDGLPSIANPVITPALTTTYQLTVTDSRGQQAFSSATITVLAPPVPTITASGPTTFCKDGNVTLKSSAATTYLWSNGRKTRSINVTASGSYVVTVTNTLGCTAASTAEVVQVNPLPKANITPNGPTTFCTGGSVKLTASLGTSDTYAWNTGATTRSITASVAGDYDVTVSNANGCSAISDAVTVSINCNVKQTLDAKTDGSENTATTTTGNYFEATVYPNPYTSQFKLQIQSSNKDNVQIKVFDITGRLLDEELAAGNSTDLMFGANYAAGLYLIQLCQGGVSHVLRVVKSE